jgi:hypothetical protein
LHRYGVFLEDPDQAGVRSHSRLMIDAGQLARQWRRCGLTADFWARYGSLFLDADPASGWLSRDAAFHVFTYLLNELFENCVKFSRGPVLTVTFDGWLFSDHLIYQVSNHILPGDVAEFTRLIQELLTGDVEEQYFRKLEQNAESNFPGSGLGYLSLMKDYGVTFGFDFESMGTDSVRVAIQTLVSMREG